jgi:biopolymer transport protein ExbB/TolQ
MNHLYESVVQLFYQLANAFFWPVAVALLVLFAWSLFDLGTLFYAMWRRRCEQRTDLKSLALALARRVDSLGQHPARGALEGVALAPSLARFWRRVEGRLREVESAEDLDLWLDETLRREENEAASRLDRSRAFVRLGPMLGLAGTIIPLGPALRSLLSGDMAGMVNHLVVGFGAVVCGLVLSGVAYFITLVRERWARAEIKEMEDLCELLMRNLQRQGRQRGPAAANMNGKPSEEAAHAGIRQA